jgi:hypothetical protein
MSSVAATAYSYMLLPCLLIPSPTTTTATATATATAAAALSLGLCFLFFVPHGPPLHRRRLEVVRVGTLFEVLCPGLFVCCVLLFFGRTNDTKKKKKKIKV